ncbi:MAG TPA: arginine repressor [Actinomycetota bacterium]|nr:arginine repressor [Actinomycetota bacterium]
MRILHEGSAHSQRDIVDALQAAGHDVTQATVSRDLREVGAAKVRMKDGFVYRLPDEVPRSLNGDLVARSLRRTLDDFAIEIRAAGSLVVVDTAPGHASAVARAVDLAGIDDIVGTVAGDDTIFVATPGNAEAARLAEAWRHQPTLRRTT